MNQETYLNSAEILTINIKYAESSLLMTINSIIPQPLVATQGYCIEIQYLNERFPRSTPCQAMSTAINSNQDYLQLMHHSVYKKVHIFKCSVIQFIAHHVTCTYNRFTVGISYGRNRNFLGIGIHYSKYSFTSQIVTPSPFFNISVLILFLYLDKRIRNIVFLFQQHLGISAKCNKSSIFHLGFVFTSILLHLSTIY